MLCADPRRVRHILYRALECVGCCVECSAASGLGEPLRGSHGHDTDSGSVGRCAEVFRDGGLPAVVASNRLTCSNDIGTHFVCHDA